MAMVNEKHNPSRPVQVDPKTGKPLPAATPARAASPTLLTGDPDSSNTGFFGSFFAAKNKKKAAAMEAPPPTLKASGTLSEREGIEVEVISMYNPGCCSVLKDGPTDTWKNRTAHLVLLQHCQAHHDRHGPQGDHVESRQVHLLLFPLVSSDTYSCVCSFTKDEMQKELLENMYRQSELDDLLKESDYTIRRRKECQQMVDSLGRASEIVSQVQ